jgi:hypothetical protein
MVCAAALRAPAVLPERDAEEPVSYKFDRRRGLRRAAPGWLPATFTDGAGRFGVAGVDVLDAGPGGLGLRSNRPIEPGMTISLHHPGARFAAITATVIRCTPGDGETYLIGLSTTPRRAA